MEVKNENMVAKQMHINWDEKKYADTHDFNKEPIVEGTLVRTGMVTIKGKETMLIVLKTSKGERTVWLGAVLESSLGDDMPVIGDYVGIKYLGMKKGSAGFEYRDFDSRVIHVEVVE